MCLYHRTCERQRAACSTQVPSSTMLVTGDGTQVLWLDSRHLYPRSPGTLFFMYFCESGLTKMISSKYNFYNTAEYTNISIWTCKNIKLSDWIHLMTNIREGEENKKKRKRRRLKTSHFCIIWNTIAEVSFRMMVFREIIKSVSTESLNEIADVLDGSIIRFTYLCKLEQNSRLH